MLCGPAFAGEKAYPLVKELTLRYVDAKELTLIGKSNVPTGEYYHRIDTCAFKGFSKGEREQAISPAGWALVFKTDSPVITVNAEYGWEYSGINTMPMAYHGFDLYIKDGKNWLWAGAKGNGRRINGKYRTEPLTLVEGMERSEKLCLLYLPLYSELKTLSIGIAEDAKIEAAPSPFHHKVVFHGSSFTQGISVSRAGMAYPMQFERFTGLEVIGLGFSGNCKMQEQFAHFLESVEADAYVFDAFSNPTAAMIKERLEGFVERMVKAHPGKPLIFQRTITRESGNFDLRKRAINQAQRDMSDSLMPILCKKYKDVYYVKANASADDHETSVDGTHPNDRGYTLWARSIEKPILKILAKYGIK
ncbi:MAG: SGNH/GDSL hydrolase family protein [Bacteroidales bacterium]|nr:SGNH/GDSL hydrolase family protein [Bacteroidales bacterium]